MVLSTASLKLPKNWVIYLGDSFYKWEKHFEIKVFLHSNASFTISVFTCALANDLHICKKDMKRLQNKSF